MKKKLIIAAIILIALFIGYNYIYQDHRNIQEETPEFVLSAEDLFAEFNSEPEKSLNKFLNKTIQVSGIITETNLKDITINDNIFCQFQELVPSMNSATTEITIKGRCIGYDELLEIIKLDQCSTIK